MRAKRSNSGSSIAILMYFSGFNERIPRLAEFLEAIEQHRDYVVPELFTHATYSAVVARQAPQIHFRQPAMGIMTQT